MENALYGIHSINVILIINKGFFLLFSSKVTIVSTLTKAQW